jgi:site-specific DNA recombinase
MYFYIGRLCDTRTMPESTIEQVMVTAIHQTLCDKYSFLSTLKNNIENILIHENDTTLTEYNEPLVRRLIEKIAIFEGKLTVEFKSNVTVDVEA